MCISTNVYTTQLYNKRQVELYFRRLAVQEALGDVDQINEELLGGHIEAFLAYVLPLQALELLDGFNDLGRVFVEPVLLLSVTRAHLLELGADPEVSTLLSLQSWSSLEVAAGDEKL